LKTIEISASCFAISVPALSIGMTRQHQIQTVLAPMVRISNTSMRLLALEYGADWVMSPEIIDRRLIASTRHIKPNKTIDYIDDTKKCNLKVHPIEEERLIVQLGTANPTLALQAALRVQNDVAGININCGYFDNYRDLIVFY
jgi:tRNA-dihydrouridine synthase 2